MGESEQGAIPDNHVLGVLKGVDDGPLTQELRRGGFEDYQIMTGEDVAESIDADAGGSDPITRVIYRVVNHLSEQVAYLEQYEEEAREGNRVVAVQVKDHDAAHEVTDILERHHVVDIRFFGKMTVTDMTPRSNPSAPSDELP